jgi:hypothetical protein
MTQAKCSQPSAGPAGDVLRLCLSGTWDPSALQKVEELLREGSVSWDAVQQLARAERLAPQLNAVVRNWDLAPPSFSEGLQSAHATNIVRDTQLFCELQDVLHQMLAADVDVILIKGAALSMEVYGNNALRPMADLDLLVPPDRVEHACRALAGLGYVVSCLEPWAGHSRRYRHVLEYQRQLDDGLSRGIDLHWGLVDVPFYGRIPVDDLFARALPVRIGSENSLILAPEDHLLCLCLQLALHDRYHPALFRYFDMAALIHHTGDKLDWHAVAQRAVDWQSVIPVQRTMARLEALWPGTVPAGRLREIDDLQAAHAEHLIHRWVVDRPRNPTSDVLLSLVTLPGIGRRVRFLLEQSFPSAAYMRALYCQQHPCLWPLTYLQRAGLTLWYPLTSVAQGQGE